MSTTTTAAAAAMPAPIQHHCPHMPKPLPEPPIGKPPVAPPGPQPRPPFGPPPPSWPPFGRVDSMRDLEGRGVRDIARGIVELYDRDRNGTISAAEATRVQREYGRFGIDMYQGMPVHGDGAAADAAIYRPPYGGGTRVDVYSMTRLLFAADANHDGQVGINELTRHLRSFDTGDSWGPTVLPDGTKPARRAGARDGILSGSEFQRFLQRSGEQHVAGWHEPSWRYPWYDYDRPMPLPLTATATANGGDAGDATRAAAPAAEQATHAADAPSEG